MDDLTIDEHRSRGQCWQMYDSVVGYKLEGVARIDVAAKRSLEDRFIVKKMEGVVQE